MIFPTRVMGPRNFYLFFKRPSVDTEFDKPGIKGWTSEVWFWARADIIFFDSTSRLALGTAQAPNIPTPETFHSLLNTLKQSGDWFNIK
jgi:hypothetical protein